MGMARAGYRQVDAEQSIRANRKWWHDNASSYLSDFGDFLGAADFRWCPEGLREAEAQLLGDVAGHRVLEVGAGAGQCSRWLAGRGAKVLAIDAAEAMVAASNEINVEQGTAVPGLVADARALPLPTASIDIAFSAFGALPFVPDGAAVHAEVARVLRPGGRWVFAVVHPARWMFPDDPSEAGLGVTRSYFDRRPYVEEDEAGNVCYAEYHRTLSDHVAEITGAGLVVEALHEPEWQVGNTRIWGGWGPERGRYLPGTAIFATHRPA